ncbi:metallopeptidase family protein [SAR202 cluster bacterium AC-647-N09_OGT_505m]|nr:metallopeptidase family protein [SAR202 cluster bacterium AC-647-N09_OGT_505m]
MVLRQEEFEGLVLNAIGELPQELLVRLDNVAVVVQLWPSRAQMASAELDHEHQLLGLYEGIPLTDRESYNLVLPDKITIFQGPLEAMCHTLEEMTSEIKVTVAHEIAHHFGIDDERLGEIALG